MDTTGTIDPQTGDVSTEKTSTESTGQGEVDAQASQGEKDNAGGSQDSSEGGKANGTESRKRFRSKNQTIYELRQSVRERDEKLGELEQRFSQFEQKFQPRQERKPSRTFWEAPEEVLDERISGHLSEMEKRILDNLQQSRQQDQQTSEWKQETSEAAKLITNQKGITDDDILEIQEIVRATPAMNNLRPKERAEYALYLWNKEKGISDKSDLKNKAASVQGSPGSGGGKRIWTEPEMEREMKKFPVDPKGWTKEQMDSFDKLDSEFRLAYHEHRVRK